MKYIKVRFKLTTPSTEPYDVYGWDTLWNKKAQILGGQAVEPGQIVNFQPVTVQPDGKFLVLGTQRNIKAIKAMIEQRQMTLGPGESLDAPEVKEAPKEDVWPDAPGAKAEDALEEGEVAEEVAVVAPKARRKVNDTALKPDLE